jgi:hypothetical protein
MVNFQPIREIFAGLAVVAVMTGFLFPGMHYFEAAITLAILSEAYALDE